MISITTSVQNKIQGTISKPCFVKQVQPNEWLSCSAILALIKCMLKTRLTLIDFKQSNHSYVIKVAFFSSSLEWNPQPSEKLLSLCVFSVTFLSMLNMGNLCFLTYCKMVFLHKTKDNNEIFGCHQKKTKKKKTCQKYGQNFIINING